METWSAVGKPEKSFRFMMFNEQLLYKGETITSYLMLLFSPSSSPASWGELAALLFRKEKRWKVQSGEKCSVIFQSISIPYQNHSGALFYKLFILQREDASCLWRHHHKSTLINQKQWWVLMDFHLAGAPGSCLPASGKEGEVLDPSELPARGCGDTPGLCHLYSWLTEGL